MQWEGECVGERKADHPAADQEGDGDNQGTG